MKANPFADYIRKHCKAKKLTLEKLAEMSGIARGTLYRLLEADSSPKIEYLLALANGMGIHHNILFRLKWQDIGVLSPLPTDPLIAIDNSGFLDETIPDGMIITAGSTFTKTWTIQNTGDTVWQNRYLLCIDEPVLQNNYPKGESLHAHQLIPMQQLIRIPTTYPDDIIKLSVDYQAPQIAGRYISCWKMVDKHGRFYFPEGIGLSVSILVRGFGVSS